MSSHHGHQTTLSPHWRCNRSLHCHNSPVSALQAKVLYDAIEGSGGFYTSPVEPSVRSRMNVPFTIPSNPDLEAEFIKGASDAGLVRGCL
jgi:phosphoserine aminotransferase